MKAGDKVSFKDEKLNGVILEILQNGKVLVELEDGFPMEALQNQLVGIRREFPCYTVNFCCF